MPDFVKYFTTREHWQLLSSPYSIGFVVIIIYLLRHEGSTGKHKHTNIQNIQKRNTWSHT